MEPDVKDNEKGIKESGLIISFPWGMPGLEYSEYILSPLAQDSPFYFLQSVAQPEVGLLLMNPFTAFEDYEFDLNEDVAGQLKINDEKQVAVLCTVNTSRGIESVSINLLAPIVINTEHLLGRQVVLNDPKYSLRAPLILKKSAEKGEC